MLREIMKPKFKGQTMEFNLSKWGYKNFLPNAHIILISAKGSILSQYG